EDVRVEDPLDLGEICLEPDLDLALRVVDDRGVEQQHEDRRAEHSQHRPWVDAVWLTGRCAGWWSHRGAPGWLNDGDNSSIMGHVSGVFNANTPPGLGHGSASDRDSSGLYVVRTDWCRENYVILPMFRCGSFMHNIHDRERNVLNDTLPANSIKSRVVPGNEFQWS